MVQLLVRPINSNSKYTELDLFGKEVIELTQINKNDEVFDAVFTPITMDFNIPATDNNKNALINYFDINLMKTRKKFMEAIVLLNGVVYKKGKIQINTIQYIEGVSTTISINFYTSITSLKDKIGEDKLTDLIYDVNSFVWNADNVYRNASGQIPNDDIIVPLISNKRAWNYKGGGIGDLNNPDYAITQDELRPCVRFHKVMEAILTKYDLQVDCPLFQRPEYQNLFIYLNNNASDKEFSYPIINTQPFTMNYPSLLNVAPVLGETKVTYDTTPTSNHKAFISIGFGDLVNVNTGTRWLEDLSLTINILTESNNSFSFTVNEYSLDGSNIYFPFTFEPIIFGRVFTFNTVLNSKVPLNVFSPSINYVSYLTSSLNTFRTAVSNNNSIQTKQQPFDIASTISNMKVSDFLSSFFKMFNIRVIETSSEGYFMEWLTPQDIVDNKIDLTPFVNLNQVEIHSPTLYKEIKFTHAENNLFRNKKYRESAAAKEYGSEIYIDEETDNSDTYEVETNFQILNYFELGGTTLLTSYAWETNGDQYFGSDNLILMYFNGYAIAKDPNFFDTNVYFKYKLTAGSLPVQLAQYAKFSNIETTSKQTLTFDIDIDPVTKESRTKTLFSSYYKSFIENIYGNNSRKFKFNAKLPLNTFIKIDICSIILINNMSFYINEIKTDLVTGVSQLDLQYIEYKLNGDNGYNIYPVQLLNLFQPDVNLLRIAFNGSSVDAPHYIAGHTVRYKRVVDSLYEYMDVPVHNNNEVSYVVTIPNLYSNTQYEISVRAYDELGKVSSWVTIYASTFPQTNPVVIPDTTIVIKPLPGGGGGITWELSNELKAPGSFNVILSNQTNLNRFNQSFKANAGEVVIFDTEMGVGVYTGSVEFVTLEGSNITNIDYELVK